MKTMIRPVLTLFVSLTVLTGVLYPLAVTGLAQLFFAHEANGSILLVDGKPVGSALIGQSFTSPGYFRGRPSATATRAYNPELSSASNLGPTNPALKEVVGERIDALKAAAVGSDTPVPIDLVTASASGLDPEISLAGAYYQAARVASVRELSVKRVEAFIEEHAQRPWLGIFGEPCVNVLQLNLALDVWQIGRVE